MFDQVLNTHLNVATKGVVNCKTKTFFTIWQERFLSLLPILYPDHKFIRSTITWAYSSEDNRLWKRKSRKPVQSFSKTCSQEQFNLMIRLKDVLKTFFKTSWRRFEDVLKTFWRRLEDVLKTFSQDVLKTSWRRIAKTNILILTKTSWRRFEDVFWRREAEASIFVLIKTSWRRLHQDECFLGYVFSKIFLRYLRIVSRLSCLEEGVLKYPKTILERYKLQDTS